MVGTAAFREPALHMLSCCSYALLTSGFPFLVTTCVCMANSLCHSLRERLEPLEEEPPFSSLPVLLSSFHRCREDHLPRMRSLSISSPCFSLLVSLRVLPQKWTASFLLASTLSPFLLHFPIHTRTNEFSCIACCCFSDETWRAQSHCAWLPFQAEANTRTSGFHSGPVQG